MYDLALPEAWAVRATQWQGIVLGDRNCRLLGLVKEGTGGGSVCHTIASADITPCGVGSLILIAPISK
jgi:hypothetical protein